jgi:hypothetical protein
MKNLIILLFFFSFYQSGVSQKLSMPDSGRYIIHRWLQPIGEESYTVTRDNRGIHFDINFLFTDRGTRVPLKTKMSLTKDFSPASFVIKGKQDRQLSIDDSIIINQGQVFVKKRDTTYTEKLVSNAFPVVGSVPVTMQVLLIHYWNSHGRPTLIKGLPNGEEIEIRYKGIDTMLHNNVSLIFDRYSIKNLRWQLEHLWLDSKGELAALTFGFGEYINEKYISLLTGFTAKTAFYTLMEFRTPAKNDASIIINNVRLIDVKSGEQHPASTIIVKNGIITWTGPSNKAIIPKGSRVIDAKGLTVLPGLWDMHQHYGNVDLGPALIGMGITTVRDCANEFESIELIKQSIDKRESIGPTILRAGLIDGRSPSTLGIITADSKEEAVERIAKYKAGGYDQIKIYSSVRPEIVKVICDEAHRQGLSVTGHIPRGMKLLDGIDSGMDQVNHMNHIVRLFEFDSSTFAIDFAKPVNKQVLEKLKAKQIVMDPTLNIFEMNWRPLDKPVSDLYPSYSNWPKSSQAMVNKIGMPADTISKYKYPLRVERFKQLLLRLFQEGIPIVAGTDNSSLPGYVLYRELELYVESGLTPLQAIQTATLIPAKVMGRLSQSGTIEVGKQADMILVDGDPLKRLSDIQKIKWVIKDGQVYNAAELKNSVGFK